MVTQHSDHLAALERSLAEAATALRQARETLLSDIDATLPQLQAIAGTVQRAQHLLAGWGAISGLVSDLEAAVGQVSQGVGPVQRRASELEAAVARLLAGDAEPSTPVAPPAPPSAVAPTLTFAPEPSAPASPVEAEAQPATNDLAPEELAALDDEDVVEPEFVPVDHLPGADAEDAAARHVELEPPVHDDPAVVPFRPRAEPAEPLAAVGAATLGRQRTVSVVVSRAEGQLDLVRVHSALDQVAGVTGLALASYTRGRAVILLDTDRAPDDLPLRQALAEVFAAEGVTGSWQGDTEYVATIGAEVAI